MANNMALSWVAQSTVGKSFVNPSALKAVRFRPQHDFSLSSQRAISSMASTLRALRQTDSGAEPMKAEPSLLQHEPLRRYARTLSDLIEYDRDPNGFEKRQKEVKSPYYLSNWSVGAVATAMKEKAVLETIFTRAQKSIVTIAEAFTSSRVKSRPVIVDPNRVALDLFGREERRASWWARQVEKSLSEKKEIALLARKIAEELVEAGLGSPRLFSVDLSSDPNGSKSIVATISYQVPVDQITLSLVV